MKAENPERDAAVDRHKRDAALLEAEIERLRQERDEARADARVLAHAYKHDSRPPSSIVDRALSYPVRIPTNA